MKEHVNRMHKKRGKKTKISFDEEIINKEQAEKLLTEQKLDTIEPNKQKIGKNVQSQIKNEKTNKRKLSEKQSNNTDKPKKKRKSDQKVTAEQADNIELPTENNSLEEKEISEKPKTESNRAKKRNKHAKLMEGKKLQIELELQQKCLNYLSKWKHAREHWKFEKLKQVWLQQNLFDSSRIPNEFWEATVEYFSGSKGHSRQVVLDEALKIVEAEDDTSEENLDEDYQSKLKRARDIVQTLQ